MLAQATQGIRRKGERANGVVPVRFSDQCPHPVEADIAKSWRGTGHDPERTIGAAFCRDAQRNIACNDVVPSFQAEGAG